MFVSIADVAEYVDFESALDLEALNRGTSIYFKRKVIPMLPEKLSNKICSLRPNEEKLTFSSVFTFNEKGEITEPIKNQNSFLILKLQDKRRISSDSIDYSMLKKNLINQHIVG